MQRVASSLPRVLRRLRLSQVKRRLYSQLSAPAAQSSATSSINQEEIQFFTRLSSQWWDETGEFGMLHKMNPVRVQYVRDKLLEAARDDGLEDWEEKESGGRVLEGLDVLDVGCGGGLLSESLARLGARTLGVDASSSNISIASLHASQDPTLSGSAGSKSASLAYRHAPAEALVGEPKRFDVVCSMEVLEHVDNPAAFLRSCAELVKPGGHLFLSTMARTPLAYFLTIFAAEKLLRFVEPGTHTYSKYVNPAELVDFFRKPVDAQGAPWISRVHGGVPAATGGGGARHDLPALEGRMGARAAWRIWVGGMQLFVLGAKTG
ncbi:3-demethylubiquinone-9 3-methyltransferase [Phellopilus nigrolimitatus]|nr:3-demethylubiquinone-9 3-methyltransferase [Phellopilus nigrolimitatus]